MIILLMFVLISRWLMFCCFVMWCCLCFGFEWWFVLLIFVVWFRVICFELCVVGCGLLLADGIFIWFMFVITLDISCYRFDFWFNLWDFVLVCLLGCSVWFEFWRLFWIGLGLFRLLCWFRFDLCACALRNWCLM